MKNLSYHEIEDAAEEFRKKYDKSQSVPVPVEEIAEIELKIEILTCKGLFQRESIDAFLSPDMKELHIDEEHYLGRQENRGRFTVAHELGHYVLHPTVVNKTESIADWKKLLLGEGTGRDLYESQADDFAGCLLMPRDLVVAEVKRQKSIAEKKFKELDIKMPDEATLSTYIATPIAKMFDVPGQSAEIRMSKIAQYPR